ncbi:mucin-5AC-like [Neocloeon triangulifer]|uniref:mucin-5AC-like n=1 Tax=Neocloeon triangulifer TaxID=2078957 RepID=UPI00286F0EFD|nr:mucin-5AC-like [Neocloeon triangulifer]
MPKCKFQPYLILIFFLDISNLRTFAIQRDEIGTENQKLYKKYCLGQYPLWKNCSKIRQSANEKSGKIQFDLLNGRNTKNERQKDYGPTNILASNLATPPFEPQRMAKQQQRRRRTSAPPRFSPKGSGRRRSTLPQNQESNNRWRRQTMPDLMNFPTASTTSTAGTTTTARPMTPKASINPVFNKPLRTPKKKGIQWNKIIKGVKDKHKGKASSSRSTAEGDESSTTPSNREDVEVDVTMPDSTASSDERRTSRGTSSSISDSEALSGVTNIMEFYGVERLADAGSISTTPKSTGSDEESTPINSASRSARATTASADEEDGEDGEDDEDAEDEETTTKSSSKDKNKDKVDTVTTPVQNEAAEQNEMRTTQLSPYTSLSRTTPSSTVENRVGDETEKPEREKTQQSPATNPSRTTSSSTSESRYEETEKPEKVKKSETTKSEPSETVSVQISKPETEGDIETTSAITSPTNLKDKKSEVGMMTQSTSTAKVDKEGGKDNSVDNKEGSATNSNAKLGETTSEKPKDKMISTAIDEEQMNDSSKASVKTTVDDSIFSKVAAKNSSDGDSNKKEDSSTKEGITKEDEKKELENNKKEENNKQDSKKEDEKKDETKKMESNTTTVDPSEEDTSDDEEEGNGEETDPEDEEEVTTNKNQADSKVVRTSNAPENSAKAPSTAASDALDE